MQTDDIREAVFRYQFDPDGSGLNWPAQVYFISVGEKSEDPSADFLKRFEHHQPPVQKVSASQSNPKTGVVDQQTGEHGVIYRVTSIAWISDTEVEVGGEYYLAGRNAGGHIYTVMKENGKWRVTKDRSTWISQSEHPLQPTV